MKLKSSFFAVLCGLTFSSALAQTADTIYHNGSILTMAPGRHHVVVSTALKVPKPGAPADIILIVDGTEVARTTVKMTVPAAFTASESFDVGVDLGSPVSRDYFDRRPFRFEGKISQVTVELN